MKLYNYWRSSASWRVRIALAYKNVPYEYVSVNLGNNEHLGEAYAKVNMFHEAPTLVVDGVRIGQSLAIIEYLEERFPTPTLLPGSLLERARIRQVAEVVNSGIHPLQNMRVVKKLGAEYGADDAAQQRWRADFIARGFVGLETLLHETAKTHCVGEAFSLADCCLVPQVLNARRFGVDLAPYPTIRRLEEGLLAHPAIVKSHPERQPDTPAEARA